MSLEPQPEIPRLVITPSTPTDDLPIPMMGRGRRPTLFRTQSLLDQMDNQLPLHPSIPNTATRRSSPSSSSGSSSKVRLDKKSAAAGFHHITPLDVGTRQRPGRGTAASLVLVALAFLLVLSSALLSPESITALLHSETEWMASDKIQFIGANTNTPASEPYTMDENQFQQSHHDNDDGKEIESPLTLKEEEPSRDPRTEIVIETETESEKYHTTTGVMTNNAWRSYLKRKEQVTGQAGPTAHLEAWDFH